MKILEPLEALASTTVAPLAREGFKATAAAHNCYDVLHTLENQSSQNGPHELPAYTPTEESFTENKAENNQPEPKGFVLRDDVLGDWIEIDLFIRVC